jgi:peptidyl-prolyl cis-trans isomerase B (cyclophilin B)
VMEETVMEETVMEETVMEEETEVIDEKEGGGCLIATATFGSELAPQVQQLRELRDNTILSTESGTAFMTGFNQFYYSFSPTIADLERENPVFKEVVKLTLTPMISSLSLLNYVDIDSEQEMLGYGISLIILNIGMYAGIPAFGILKLYQFRKN